LFTLWFVEDGMPRAHRLREGESLIGRAPTCELVITAPLLSRQHARVRVAGTRVYVTDAGSTHGTMINNTPITGEVELKSGDSFTIGQIAITLGSDPVEGDTDQIDVLGDGHQLVGDSNAIVKSIAMVRPDADRRSGEDRRKINVGRIAGERRSGRDRRGGRVLRLLSEIGKTLVKVQPLKQVLERVVDLAFDAVPAERAFLLLRDDADQPLTARVMRNRDGTTPASVTLSRTIINKVMRERVAILAKDALYDTRLGGSGSIQLMNVRSFMCAPLWNRDEVIGVLYCDNPRSKKYSEDDLEVFAALCNYAAVAIEQARLSGQLIEETRRRQQLQRYHSPGVINKILHGGGADGAFLAQTRDVSVLFCDIVTFTTMTQHMEPAAVGAMLNEFFERMTEIIFDHDGTLDKFIGDAILAVFGAPLDQPDHASRAVGAAVAMRRELARLNAERPDRPLRMRTAINSGLALTGDIGSAKRREFTVLGDVVNTASRIESSATQPDQIVISEFTRDRLRPGFQLRQLADVTLRGRDSALKVFEVLD
jgi:adenylate cyclase